jgi:NAD(P)-dependent dehydrogenase (short-subunit alcohol dehydrogenase family)
MITIQKNVIEQIIQKHKRIDIFVNNVWGSYEHYNDGTKFWKEKEFWTIPVNRFDKMFNAGTRAHYSTSVYTAKYMAYELEKYNISVITIYHGLVWTESVLKAYD